MADTARSNWRLSFTSNVIATTAPSFEGPVAWTRLQRPNIRLFIEQSRRNLAQHAGTIFGAHKQVHAERLLHGARPLRPRSCARLRTSGFARSGSSPNGSRCPCRASRSLTIGSPRIGLQHLARYVIKSSMPLTLMIRSLFAASSGTKTRRFFGGLRSLLRHDVRGQLLQHLARRILPVP